MVSCQGIRAMSDGLPSLTGKGNGRFHSLAAVLSDAQYLELIMGAGSFHKATTDLVLE